MPRPALAFACLLFSCAGVVFLHTIVLVDRAPEQTFFYNLPPFFDGVQYFAEAAGLVNESTSKIWFNGELHPSIYPFGYSLVVAALIPFVQEPVSATYLANIIASGLILCVAGLVTWRIHGLFAASVVVLVIATMPAFVILGNAPLSGSTAGLVMIACVGSWLLYAHERQPGWGILASFLVGVGVWFKTGFVFFLPLLVFSSLAPREISYPRRLRTLVVHGFASAIGVAPVLVYNWVAFGSPVRTGYHYWSSDSGLMANFGARPRFALGNIWPRLVDLGREAFEAPLAFNTANIFASGSWMGASLMLLLMVAAVGIVRQRAWLAIVAGSSGYLLSMLCYYRYFGRLYFPLLLIGALAIGPLISSVTNLGPGKWKRVCSVALGVLLVGSVVGFSRPGSPLELPPLLQTARFERQVAANFLLAREVRAHVRGKECLIVTDLLTPFVSAVVGPPVRVISLEGERQFSYRPRYRFSIESRDAEISTAIRGHGCVVLALASEFSNLEQKLSAGDDFHWETFYEVTHRGNREVGAARLVSDPPPG